MLLGLQCVDVSADLARELLLLAHGSILPLLALLQLPAPFALHLRAYSRPFPCTEPRAEATFDKVAEAAALTVFNSFFNSASSSFLSSSSLIIAVTLACLPPGPARPIAFFFQKKEKKRKKALSAHTRIIGATPEHREMPLPCCDLSRGCEESERHLISTMSGSAARLFPCKACRQSDGRL
jgi:hypothetical protein